MSIEMTIEDDNGRAMYNNPYAWSPGPSLPPMEEQMEEQQRSYLKSVEQSAAIRLKAIEDKVVALTRKVDKLLYVIDKFAQDIMEE